MTDDIVILDVENSEVVVFEGADTPDVIDGQEEVFIVSVGEQGPPGITAALPGGTTGQLRAKASNADYDEHWVDPPTAGTWGQISGAITDQSDLQAQFADALAFAADQG